MAWLEMCEDRGQHAQVEMIVQAGADDVAVEARAGDGSADGGGSAHKGVYQWEKIAIQRRRLPSNRQEYG